MMVLFPIFVGEYTFTFVNCNGGQVNPTLIKTNICKTLEGSASMRIIIMQSNTIPNCMIAPKIIHFLIINTSIKRK